MLNTKLDLFFKNWLKFACLQFLPHLGCEMAGDMDLEEEDPVGEGEGLGLGLGLGRASGALTPSSRDSGRPSSLPSWNNRQLQELVVIVKRKSQKLQQVIIPQKCFKKYL